MTGLVRGPRTLHPRVWGLDLEARVDGVGEGPQDVEDCRHLFDHSCFRVQGLGFRVLEFQG